MDGKWYRATIEKALAADKIKPSYDVVFIDFGNRERVEASKTRPIPPALASIEPTAVPATLAYLKVNPI